jgi:hypothetical protein
MKTRMLATDKDKNIFSLHRYFIWADRMRVHFDYILMKKLKSPKSKSDIETNLYMSYWYAGMYVVIEGWKELKLSDFKIEQLLDSPNVDLLKRYRNGVFHFQKEYFDERFLGFIRDGKNAVKWIRELREEFSRFFLDWVKRSELTE